MKIEYVTSLQANITSPPLNFRSLNPVNNPNFSLEIQFPWHQHTIASKLHDRVHTGEQNKHNSMTFYITRM